MHAYIWTYVQTYMRVYVHMYIHTDRQTDMHAYTHKHYTHTPCNPWVQNLVNVTTGCGTSHKNTKHKIQI
jgi:hypothetical protein